MNSIITGAAVGLFLALLIEALVTIRARGFRYWLTRAFGVKFLAAFAGGGLGFVLGLFVGMICGQMMPHIERVLGPATIVAMQGGNGVSGAFVLGTGNFDTFHHYTFYLKNENGSVSPQVLSADRSVQIFQDENLKETGTWQSIELICDPASSLRSWALCDSRIIRQELRVPVGTVQHDFRAN